MRILIKIYKASFSHYFKGRCRFYPSCSAYALEAFTAHRFPHAFTLTFKRLLRCHPWGAHGIDFVPHAPSKSVSS